MSLAPAAPIEERLTGMASAIRQLIPAAEVRLFGSRARGQAGPDSDVDLLITAPDAWLAQVDLVLQSCTEANRRARDLGC